MNIRSTDVSWSSPGASEREGDWRQTPYQVRPSSRPVPFVADVAMIVHVRLSTVLNPKASAIAAGSCADLTSCLLAKTQMTASSSSSSCVCDYSQRQDVKITRVEPATFHFPPAIGKCDATVLTSKICISSSLAIGSRSVSVLSTTKITASCLW